VSKTRLYLIPRVRACCLACLRPFGYLAFAAALGALAGAARLLGDEHELGVFARHLNRMIWRYPEVTRRGVQMAWVMWIVLFVVAITPLDPIASRWDEVLLGALALGVLWRRMIGGRRVER
jgi:dolichol kinase